MRVLITGGRDYADREKLYQILDAIQHYGTAWQPGERRFMVYEDNGCETPTSEWWGEIDTVIHGHCPTGADQFADDWGLERQIATERYEADWDNLDAVPALIRKNSTGKFYNALAGFQRNTRMVMIGRPHLGIICPGGDGTAHCAGELRKHRVPVIRVPA